MCCSAITEVAFHDASQPLAVRDGVLKLHRESPARAPRAPGQPAAGQPRRRGRLGGLDRHDCSAVKPVVRSVVVAWAWLATSRIGFASPPDCQVISRSRTELWRSNYRLLAAEMLVRDTGIEPMTAWSRWACSWPASYCQVTTTGALPQHSRQRTWMHQARCNAPLYDSQVHHIKGWTKTHRTHIDDLTLAPTRDNRLAETKGLDHPQKRQKGDTEWIPPRALGLRATPRQHLSPSREILAPDDDNEPSTLGAITQRMASSGHISHVSDTARWTALYRATETARPDALFSDLLAELLAGEHGRAIPTGPPG